MTSLYETDFLEWTARNAELLRSGRVHEADLANIAEELESLGIGQKRLLSTRLRVLLAHLLKWQAQPAERSRSWRVTINSQRNEIADLLEDMPSLQRHVSAALARAYRRAAGEAAEEMGLLDNPFPEACPYTAEQVLDHGFFPV